MRLLTIILFLLNSLTGYSQNPFDKGKTIDYYYLSLTDLDSLGIYEIKNVVKLEKTGLMHQDTDFFIISFSSAPNRITDNWHIYNDSSKIPELINLMNESRFINGEFWELENGLLQSSGLLGYGTLCENYYERDSTITKIYRVCKGDDEGRLTGEIKYYDNGLPKLKTTIEGSYIENTLKVDTLYYIYDVNFKIIGTKWNYENDVNLLFSSDKSNQGNANSNNYYQIFINDELFENFIENMTGFRPKILVIEVYRLAALTFRYDRNEKKYYQTETIELE